MKYTIGMLSMLFTLGFALSSQAEPLPKELLESVCTVGFYTLQENNIDLETLKKVPENVRNMGLDKIKDHVKKLGLIARIARMLRPKGQPEPLPTELREAVCTVGVGTLEDNAINLETLKKIPAKERNMGLQAIKDFIKDKYPAEMGKPAFRRGLGGYPAQMGEQAK